MKHTEKDEWGLMVPDVGANREVWSKYREARELKRLTYDLWLSSTQREKEQEDEIAVSIDTANLPKQNAIICIEKDSTLLSREHKQCLASRLFELGLSRLKTADWMADNLFEFTGDGGRIFDGRGHVLIIDDETIDDSYYNDKAFSWNSDIKKYATRMPKRKSSARLLPRLRLLDAAFKIAALKAPHQNNPTFKCLRKSGCPLCAANDEFERNIAS